MAVMNKKRATYINILLCFLLLVLVLMLKQYLTFSQVIVVQWKAGFFQNNPAQPEVSSHLFENTCKYLWLEAEEPSLKHRVFHNLPVSCNRTNPAILIRHINGSFSFNATFFQEEMKINKKFNKDFVFCSVHQLGGALRPSTSNNRIKRSTNISIVYIPFFVNADNFRIECLLNNSSFYKKSFMGLKNENIEDLVNSAQVPAPVAKEYDISTLSIDILALDSTSRSQFMRHMKKSKKVMQELGFVVMNGYNKVGDNSAVNLLPILADSLSEAEKYPLLDEVGDPTIESILPFSDSVDPDTIPFLWNKAKELGCETLFNDDIMNLGRGLFHYPAAHFKRGFTRPPTDHYYRPYYADLYQYLRNHWRLCLDGEILAEEFLNVWYRFISLRRHQCRFSFNFITSITHDDPNNIEYLDEALADRLERLKKEGALKNSVIIIMGDHGNRVHTIRSSFAGRIEERQPMMSVYLPEGFRTQYPQQYRNFLNNQNRFVSNFDIHETLVDLLDKNIGTNKGVRGTSLFQPIPTNRTCVTNNVVSNFCLCMEKAKEKGKIDQGKLLTTVKSYLENTSCSRATEVLCLNTTVLFEPNAMVRIGLRNKVDAEEKISKTKQSAFQYFYTDCRISSAHSDFSARFQIRLDNKNNNYDIIYDPMLLKTSDPMCSWTKSLENYCSCRNKD